jgi:4-hydroxy-tetrahydrodipicolinate synthase
MSGALRKVAGICPALFTVYTDETCSTVDYEAQRSLIRRVLEADVGALVTGGHAGEIAALDPEERAEIIRIARDEAGGRVPVIGGVVADSTREAIRQGREAQEAGADAVLFTPPSIPGWVSETEFLVRHYAAFEDAVGIPIVIFAAPSEIYGKQYHLRPDTLAAIVRNVESVVGAKITSGWDTGGFLRCMRAMKEVRDVGCLKAGGANQFGAYAYGADGNLSGGSNFSGHDDVAILRLAQQGELAKAKELSDSWMPVWDMVYGTQAGLPVVYFHYRYKLAAWLLGVIERPHMRLPQLPPPLTEIEQMRNRLIEAGKQPVRAAEQVAVAAA